MPDLLHPAAGPLHTLLPSLFDADGGITLGPIPKGMPVNLLADLQPLPEGGDPVAHFYELGKLLIQLKLDLAALPEDPTDAQIADGFKNVVPTLMKLNKCPDFVVSKGHYFGTGKIQGEPALSDDDKHALIAFLKTF